MFVLGVPLLIFSVLPSIRLSVVCAPFVPVFVWFLIPVGIRCLLPVVLNCVFVAFVVLVFPSFVVVHNFFCLGFRHFVCVCVMEFFDGWQILIVDHRGHGSWLDLGGIQVGGR